MRTAASIAILVLASPPAAALPRFAARAGSECTLCHVNPTGSGMRNGYGRNVFERVILPLAPGRPPPDTPVADRPPGDGKLQAAADPQASFAGDINEWLAVGADLRAAYIFVRPDRGAEPGADRELTSSFFLMQADLYHSAVLGDRVTLVLDVGVYSGFEAWGLVRLSPPRAEWDLLLKAGRFLPPFGVREVEHQLYTREGVGLGAADRDTGLEMTLFAGRYSLHAALVNGTVGDVPFDTHGVERRTFEKAVAVRAAARAHPGPLRAQAGGSFYWNQDVDQPNPLFGGVLPETLAPETAAGLDELRAGGFATLSLGRVTWIGDFVYVTDSFYSDALPSLAGYASYQELSFLSARGLDLIATLEFKEPDTEILDDATTRAGFVVEFFPWPFTEVRLMTRRAWSEVSPTGGAWDVVAFLHLFL